MVEFLFTFFLIFTLILISRGGLDFGLSQQCTVCTYYVYIMYTEYIHGEYSVRQPQ